MQLWNLVTELSRSMPLSKSQVEESLNVALQLEERTQYLAHWVAGALPLNDAVEIAHVSLVLDPKDQFDSTSGLTLQLAGKCVALTEVRAKYPHLVVTDSARGHSLEELTIHTTFESWGRLSFAFKEVHRDCLFAISFNAPEG